MNLSSFIGRWFKRVKEDVGALPVNVLNQIPVEKAIEPVLSPFVRGLMKSMKDHPGEWTRGPSTGYGIYYYHSTSNISVSMIPSISYYIPPSTEWGLSISDHLDFGLTNYEKQAITEAWHTYLEDPYMEREKKARADYEAAQEKRRIELKARFENLAGEPSS